MLEWHSKWYSGCSELQGCRVAPWAWKGWRLLGLQLLDEYRHRLNQRGGRNPNGNPDPASEEDYLVRRRAALVASERWPSFAVVAASPPPSLAGEGRRAGSGPAKVCAAGTGCAACSGRLAGRIWKSRRGDGTTHSTDPRAPPHPRPARWPAVGRRGFAVVVEPERQGVRSCAKRRRASRSRERDADLRRLGARACSEATQRGTTQPSVAERTTSRPSGGEPPTVRSSRLRNPQPCEFGSNDRTLRQSAQVSYVQIFAQMLSRNVAEVATSGGVSH
jgi:hypothetical protein